jgi:hypothetical protein
MTCVDAINNPPYTRRSFHVVLRRFTSFVSLFPQVNRIYGLCSISGSSLGRDPDHRPVVTSSQALHQQRITRAVMEILWPAFRTSMKCGESCFWMPEQSIDGLDAVKTRKQNRR